MAALSARAIVRLRWLVVRATTTSSRPGASGRLLLDALLVRALLTPALIALIGGPSGRPGRAAPAVARPPPASTGGGPRAGRHRRSRA